MGKFLTDIQLQKKLHSQEWPGCKDCNTNMEVKEKKILSNNVFAVLFACSICGTSAIRHGLEWKRRLR